MMGPQVDHRLDREHVSGPYFGTLTRLAVIWYLRVFVHTPPNAVPDILADNRVTIRLSMFLDCRTDVSQVPARPALLDSEIQTLLGNPDQSQPVVVHFSDRDGCCRIANEPLQRYSTIDREDVAFLQFVLGRKPVNHLLIYGSAN